MESTCTSVEELQASLEVNGPAYEHALLSLPCSAPQASARYRHKMTRSMLCCLSQKGAVLVIVCERVCCTRCLRWD